MISTFFPPGVMLALSFMLAVLLSLIFVPAVSKFATANGFFDGLAPNRRIEAQRKIHSGAIPRLGGIAMVLAFFISISLLPASLPYQGVLLGSLVIFLSGVIDDFTPISAKIRLAVQAITAVMVVLHDKLVIHHISLTKQLVMTLPEPLAVCLSVFLIVGAINAINLIDGLDGLAAGVVLIGVSLLAFADFVTTQNADVLLTIALPMMGVIFGFLRYNTHPATIFMGDGGSNWLGFMSGSLLLIALQPSTQNGIAPPFISIILTFAIPIIDTAVVMTRRMRERRSPFSADKNHFHHTLLRIGLSHSQSVTTIYFLALAFGVLGIFPAIFPKYDFPWIPYVVAMSLLLIIPASTKIDDNSIRALQASERKARTGAYSAKLTNLIYFWENLNRYVLFTILILGPALSGQVPKELGFWSLGVTLLLIISALIPQNKRGSVFFDSFAISCASLVILTVNNLNPMTIQWEGQPLQIHTLYNGLFTFIFFSSAALFLATVRRRSIIFTPPDFLLATIPLLILLLPRDWQSQYKLDIISLRCLVILMAIRVLSKRKPRYVSSLKFTCVAALGWVYLVAVHGVRILY